MSGSGEGAATPRIPGGTEGAGKGSCGRLPMAWRRGSLEPPSGGPRVLPRIAFSVLWLHTQTLTPCLMGASVLLNEGVPSQRFSGQSMGSE